MRAIIKLVAAWRSQADELEPDWPESQPWDNADQQEDAAVADVLRRCATEVEVALGLVDIQSSNSRQHYIETGRYMTHAEVEEWSND